LREWTAALEFAAMLRIIPQSNATAAKSYYSQADYYAAGSDVPARWGGRGARMLGLSGEVAKADFDALCDNRDPRSGSNLTPRTRTGRTVLYDFNFHVPKSLSVLIERTGNERLLAAVRQAADATMSELEAEVQTRVRRDGRDENRATGNLVWASILHRTTRPAKEDGQPDPHTHLHVCVFNATFDGVEARWKAAQFRDVVRDAPYWQAQFHSRLTKSLADLGYCTERTTAGWEVAGVPRSVRTKFSRRTREIEELAAELGITDPDAKAKLGATSRQAKGDENLTDLRAYWDGRLTPAERAALDRVASDAASGDLVPLAPTAEAAARHAVAHCFERAAVVPEKLLVAEALKVGVGGVTAEEVRRELNALGLITRMWDGRLVATTQQVLAEEQRTLAFARSGRGTCAPLVPRHVITRDWLNPGQRTAVGHVLTSPDRVILVRGAAGTGKTTLTSEAVEAIEAAGKPVAMLAPSADAGRGVLRAEGFADADTVARFLIDPTLRESARDGVIWVDEAGLLGVPTLGRVFDAAAELNARVVLMGDARQHAGVERGSALRTLETLAGLPVAAVTDVRRQTGAYKAAVEALADGRPEDGFDRLDRLKWVREVADDGERDGLVAKEYAAATAAGEGVLVVSPTHAEGERVTAAVRGTLKRAGRLGEEQTLTRLVPVHLTEAERRDRLNYAAGDMLEFVRAAPGHKAGTRLRVADNDAVLPLDHADRFRTFRTDELAVAVGDRLRITANGRTRDGEHRLNNGAVYTVAGFTERGDVRLNNGWVVDRGFGHWDHGYVGTSHASQGKTVDRVIVAQSGASLAATSREQFYVSVSRGRKTVSVYTHDKSALRDAVTRSDPRLSATELVTAAPLPRPDAVRRVIAERQQRGVWERARRARMESTGDERKRHAGYGAGGGT
jgi:conjugative relaxase-like TrwC/TraI family protein